MGKLYRSAQGKMVDIDALRLMNESAIAVGNAKVNARGDKLGPGGVVVQPRNQAMDQRYRKVHTPMSNSQPPAPEADPIPEVDQAVFEDPNFEEELQATEPTTEAAPPQKPMRGSLADSVAKSVTVEPTETRTATKPQGPQRI